MRHVGETRRIAAPPGHQVRPLVPGTAACLVIVVSRVRLSGLVREYGAQRVEIGLLRPHESADLLSRILGHARVAAEPDAAAQLCRLSGQLPLALRIVAASLRCHPRLTLRTAAAELASGDRLAMIGTDSEERSALRSAFATSYQPMPADAKRLFQLLGLMPRPDFDAPAAAALAGGYLVQAAAMAATAAAVMASAPLAAYAAAVVSRRAQSPWTPVAPLRMLGMAGETHRRPGA